MTVLDKKVTVTLTMSEWHKVFAAFGVMLAFADYAGAKDTADVFQKVIDNIRDQMIEQTKEVPKS